jgi:hypothetical protein
LRKIALRAVALTLATVGLLAVGGLLVVAGAEDAPAQALWVEVGSALLATGLTVGAAVLALYWTLGEQSRRRRTVRELRALERTDRSQLVVGRAKAQDVLLVSVAPLGGDVEDRVEFRFLPAMDSPREDPAEWPHIEGTALPAIQSDAEARGVLLTDDDAVDLVDARPVAVKRDGQRMTRYELTGAPTTYFRFVGMSNRLDSRVDLPPGVLDLRSHWGPGPRRLEDCARLPVPAKIGVGVVVVTADDKIVLSYRGKVFVAGFDSGGTEDDRLPVHVIGEGMIPEDLHSGVLDPRETALRGLDEELGLTSSDVTGARDGVILCGVFLDTLRWQPCFAYAVRLTIDFNELVLRSGTASHAFEADRITYMEFDIWDAELRELLVDGHPEIRTASNHAQAVLLLVMMRSFGLTEVRSALSRPPSRRRG